MIKIDKLHCTGCGACIQKCPKKCISLKKDEHGFLYPKIDEEQCINCNLCEKVCPIESNLYKTHSQKAYAAVIKDDNILLDSTSGGVFGALAKYVLSMNGAVYGAKYDNDFIVNHHRIDKIEDLSPLFGSKYVQSNIGNTYIQVEKDLKENRWVLFVGTPCQIAGLINFLGRDYDYLLTADLICHGVPSQHFFSEFVDYLHKINNAEITQISFRSKQNKGQSVVGIFEGINLTNRKKFFKKFNYFDYYYYYYFLEGYIYRNSCYSCKYACKKRVGDFTLGDFWGVEGLNLKLPIKKGCSLLIVNSKKASNVLCSLDLYLEEVSLDIAAKFNGQLVKPSTRPEFHDIIFHKHFNDSAEDKQKLFKSRFRKMRIKAKIKYTIPMPFRRLLMKIKSKIKK